MQSSAEPVWITIQTVIAIHAMQLSEHGGVPGLRDRGLLESALARPQQLLHYQPESKLEKLAAAYMCGVIRNHPFADGNKRTGFVLGALFVLRNGQRLRAPQPEAANMILDVAAGTVDEERLCAWIGTHLIPASP